MDYEKRAEESARRTKLWGIDWPGHPEGTANDETERSLQDEPERWRMLETTSDPEADYSYDDLALMLRDDGVYALVETSGCSCPSPTETWGVRVAGTVADVRACIAKEGKSWRDGEALRGPWTAMSAYVERSL